MGYSPERERERKAHRSAIIKISDDVEKLKDYVIKLYYDGYTSKRISAIFGYSPNIQPITDVLIERNIKRCADCRKIKARSEFNSDAFISDGKKHSCKECKDFKVALSRPGNTEKEKQLMLDFYHLNQEEDKRVFIINLHKEYNYRKISTITRKPKKEIINIILKSRFKKCARCEKVRHLDLFMNYSSNEDGKYFRCIICQNLEREDNEKYKKLIEEYQDLDTIEEQEHFIINLYKKEKISYRHLNRITCYGIENIRDLIIEQDIKRCSQCKELKSRQEFKDSIYGFDGKDNYCKECKNEQKNKLANYSTQIRKRLSYVEELRRDPDNPRKLQVRCANCQKWMNPTKFELYARISAIEGNEPSLGTENHFYCSDECKQICPVFNQKNHRRNQKPPTDKSRPHQKEWKDLVLQCGEYRCGICGKIVDDENELIAHHMDPVVCNPIESVDVDNGVPLCSDCDKYVHSQIPGCTRADLSKFGQQCAVN